MDTFTTASRRTATRTLSVIMGSAAIAWVLFVVARYAGLVSSAGSAGEYGQPEQIRVANYFTFAAITILGLGALFAKRRLTPLRTSPEPRSALVHSVSLLASLMLIIAAALSSWMVLMTFMGGLAVESDEAIPMARMMNLYVPIVLYTALVITVILAGFVFLPSSKPHISTPENLQGSINDADQAGHTASSGQSGQSNAQTPVSDPAPLPPTGRRMAGLAYAIPIIAIACALILGLIIYDLSRSSLQVWIWVAIFVIVGTGIFAGTVFASRSHASRTISRPVVMGAKNLNFVLTISFAVVVTSMSLGYSESAVQHLNVSPSLTLSAYNTSEKYVESVDGNTTISNPGLNLWGSDLERGSEVVVIVEPGGQEVMRVQVGHDRWVNGEKEFSEDLSPGEYKFIARAKATDGLPLEVTLPATVQDNGDFQFPTDGSAGYWTQKGRLLPVTAGWLLSDLLPAGVLLALGIALVSGTIAVRNPDRPITQSTA